MSSPKDPLGGLDDSLSAEEEAVARRFRAAAPFTGGLPLDVHAAPEGEAPAPRPPPAGRARRAQFSFPGADLQLLEDLQTRAAKSGVVLTRSQLVRAGLHALGSMTPAAFGKAVAQIAPLAKKGRPRP